MMEFLYGIDLKIFYFLNHSIANPILDVFMPFITKEKNLLPVYIAAILVLIWKGGVKGRICAALLIINVIISDQLSSHVIKEIVGRIRPCSALPDVRLLIPCGAGKSFPSSHAVNNFAAAAVLSLFYSRKKWWFVAIALLVAFSRIYVGVHYPFDMLGGIILGSSIGAAVYFVFSFFNKRILIKKYNKNYLE